MFPTLSSLIKYATGINVQLPVQTFGLFVALAFWLSYAAFKKEFIRKEKLGLIHPFVKKQGPGGQLNPSASIAYFLLVLLIGYKLIYCLQHYRALLISPSAILFSSKGNIAAGVTAGLLYITWRFFRRKNNTENEVKEVMVHPYQVTDKMLLWCAAAGFVGAILFAKLEFISELFTDPLHYLTSFNGLTFLGGFIFGAAIYLYRTKKMGIPFLVAADIGSPGIMLAYGVGRMGCHLAGDGDWGIVNTAPKPFYLSFIPDWVWAFDFPHNVIHQGKYIEGCGDAYCTILVQPVFPTSLYESACCLLLFAVLWLSRSKIIIPGNLFFIFILCLGLERFFIEFIKLNPVHCIANLCLTQAQYIAVVFCVLGVGGLLYISKFGRYFKKIQTIKL